jgi:hypothetical protein
LGAEVEVDAEEEKEGGSAGGRATEFWPAVPSLSSVVSLPVSGLWGFEGNGPAVEGGPDIPKPFFGLFADLFLGVSEE